MSLVRLLTAGRSLVGGSGSELHYRMGSPGLMPKFNSKKNPFRRQVRPATVSAETGHALVASAPAPVAALVSQPSPAATPSQPQAAAAPGRVRLAWNGLRERCAGFFTWLARPRPAATKPAIPRFEPLPIQGELSLDRITVVRNDLSDADLELVPRAPVAPATGPSSPALQPEPVLVPAAAAVAAPAQKTGVARLAWTRAGRLLGAVKS